MYVLMLESLNACAFMILSILALHPNSPVTRTQGDCTMRWLMAHFSILSPKMFLISLHNGSYDFFSSSCCFLTSSSSSNSIPSLVMHCSFLPSYSFNCCTAYSSIGSTMYKTSNPRCFNPSKNGEFSTWLFDSPVM
eukprot:NODE_281_length_11904_cov_0.253452.p8 type:complete len:136 gc:universal NODE_281_length_11904_cov_0.253452:7195-6788(-)